MRREWRNRSFPALLALAVAAAGCARGADAVEGSAMPSVVDSIPADERPAFTPEGELIRPEGWEAWVLAGTSMGLSYAEPASTPAAGEPPGDFLNVYVQPWAYERFMESGEFPPETMFVLAMAAPSRKADPARVGYYMEGIHMMEVHLKMEGQHESGWGFYGFGGGAETSARIPDGASCYSCHAAEAAYDHAFVQFYPKMRERLGLDPSVADSTLIEGS